MEEVEVLGVPVVEESAVEGCDRGRAGMISEDDVAASDQVEHVTRATTAC